MAELIAYDRMKEQIENELATIVGETGAELKFSYEKGATLVSFALPYLNEALLSHVLQAMKDQLENVRVHAYGEGYYAFQAMNQNLFDTENMLNNIKVEVLGLSTFKIEISKKGNFSQEEINLVITLYKRCYATKKTNPVQELRKLGATVYLNDHSFNWDYIAGYEEVKRRIKESIIMPLQNPKIYDSIAELTRRKFESNKPRAILFEGGPGVGKTTIAKVIATEVQIPLIYVPVESIMSKWYGQSSQNLAAIFDACEALGNCILFLDEIDSLAGSRNQNMFEATRRVLSVLLRKLDGIDAVNNTITIAATNRKQDLDHALISRFDQSIYFPEPNDFERAAIFRNYAQHLTDEELEKIASISAGLSGRNIKDVCEQAERHWARKLIIEKKKKISVPAADCYNQIIRQWVNSNSKIVSEENPSVTG